jgi:hypothetical protein
MVFPRGAWSTNAVTKEIAAPIRLNGSHFLITTEDLSKFYTHHSLDSLTVTGSNIFEF